MSRQTILLTAAVAVGLLAVPALGAPLAPEPAAGTAILAGPALTARAPGTDAYLVADASPVGDWRATFSALSDNGASLGRPAAVLEAPVEGPAPAPGMPAGPSGATPKDPSQMLPMGPGGVGRVTVGRSNGAEAWTHATETALANIRPTVTVQMSLALQLPGTVEAGAFEGGGIEADARMAVDHQVKVDSARIGSRTDQFGFRPPAALPQEQMTSIASGLDLGLLPTFLAQMGVNVSLVAAQGSQTGDVTLALVGTTQLPTDWVPSGGGVGGGPMTPAAPLAPLSQPAGASTFAFTSSTVGDSRVPGGTILARSGGGTLIPITPGGGGNIVPEPPVPEPGTLALLSLGVGAALTWRSRRLRREQGRGKA